MFHFDSLLRFCPRNSFLYSSITRSFPCRPHLLRYSSTAAAKAPANKRARGIKPLNKAARVTPEVEGGEDGETPRNDKNQTDTTPEESKVNRRRSQKGLPQPTGKGGSSIDLGEVVKTDRTRINVLSKPLCDDVLHRLGKSLQMHENCDIIDVNPGLGIWSSALHDAVKPRTHILMEPDLKQYGSALNSLVESDSSYCLVPKSGILWSNMKNLLDSDLLKNQERYESNDPRLLKPNNTLLFTANLGHYPRKTFGGFASLATLTLHQMLSAVRNNSLFHCYGQIRMLIWISDEDKSTVNPRSITIRKRFALDAQLVCESIDEVASGDEPLTRNRRETALDMESSLLVQKRMQEAGLETPPHRITSLEALTRSDAPLSMDDKGTLTVSSWQAELNDLRRRYLNKEFPSYYGEDGVPVYLDLGINNNFTSKRPFRTENYKRMRRLMYNEAQQQRKRDRWNGIIEEHDQLMAQWRLFSKDQTDVGREKFRLLDEAIQEWFFRLEDSLPDSDGKDLRRVMHDRQSLRSSPPLLFWDRRIAEPLRTDPKEFKPRQAMCLLDIKPKTVSPLLRGSNYDFYQVLSKYLLSSPTSLLTSSLKAFAPGAVDWVLPRCKTLQGPTVGRIEDLRIRMLSIEQLVEIAEVFIQWPFRPTRGQLLTRLTGVDFDDDVLEAKAP